MDQKESVAEHLGEINGMSPSGFALALHIRFNASRFLFQTYPQAWVKQYNDRGLVTKDPVVVWCFENQGTMLWRDLRDQDAHGVMAGAAAHGMKYGVSIAVLDGRTRTMCGCSRRDRDYLDAEVDDLHDRVLRLHRATAEVAELSDADVRALEAMSIRLTRDA